MDVMRDNIGKVLDRGEKLSELEVKSGWFWLLWVVITCHDNSKNVEDLADSATQFRYHSTKLQKKIWWQNCKVCNYVIKVTIANSLPVKVNSTGSCCGACDCNIR